MGPEAECTNEVKKVGFVIERHADLELRLGDLLVFYWATDFNDEYYS